MTASNIRNTATHSLILEKYSSLGGIEDQTSTQCARGAFALVDDNGRMSTTSTWNLRLRGDLEVHAAVVLLALGQSVGVVDLQHQVLDGRFAADARADVGRQLRGRRILGPGEQNHLTAAAHAVVAAVPEPSRYCFVSTALLSLHPSRNKNQQLHTIDKLRES